MENLWLFTNLTKLQMDNNIIERIEGLDTLQKLTWLGKFKPYAKCFSMIFILDLSFNNIAHIEGLDSLTELTDLSLYNNRITVIENMDSLKKLNVFSIGNNQVEDENSVSKKTQSELATEHRWKSIIKFHFPLDTLFTSI
jgi:Leucine-rich repeat (LRR) protein